MEEEEKKTIEEQVEAVETGSVEEGQTPEPAPAERKPREVFYERIRASRPDAKYDEDEDEYVRQAMGMLDELEKKSGDYDKLSEKMVSRFNQNPEEAEALLAYLDGASLPSAIRRHMGDDALTMKEGDDGWDEYVKAGEERKAQHEKNREALEAYMQNAKDSDSAMTEFIAESGLDEEGAQGFKDVVLSIINDMAVGKVSKDTLKLLKRAVDYDKDLDGAREQGRVDGRNEKIETEKKRMQGSGLPNAHAGGGASEEVEKPKGGNATSDWLAGIKRL